MRRCSALAPLLLGAALLIASGLAPGVHAAPPAPSFPVTRFTLANGLRVWVQPRDDSASIAALLVFRAGARYETHAQSGIAHFVEHMLFTGTGRWTEEQILRLIDERGGRWNGWSGFEQSGYFAQLAASDLPLALDWLAEITFRSSFPPEKIDRERQVILQEKGGRSNGLLTALDELGFGYALDRAVRRTLYPGSPLSWRVIGEDDSLDRIDRAALLAYYQTHYTSANATLVVVGNADPARVRALAEQFFGALPPDAPVAPPAPPPPAPPGPSRVVVRGPTLTDQTALMLGARTVGRAHPDAAALDVLAELLSRELTEEIRSRRGLVYGLHAYNSTFDDTGYFVISTTAASDRSAEIEGVITERLAALRTGTLDPARVEAAKAALIGRWALAMEDTMNRASSLAAWANLLDENTPIPDRAALLSAVTPADLVRVAQTYLTPETGYVGLHQPAFTVTSGAIGGGSLVGAGLLAWLVHRWRRRRSRTQPYMVL